MSATVTSDRFTTLPDEQTLAATVVALEEHGFSVEVVDDLAAARQAVLARIPRGSSVMTNTSVTLQETGIADAINDGGPFDSARNKMLALDFATQAQQMKSIGGQPDYALGSVHAVTRDGTLVIASASGSQLASYAWGAANVIFVVGAQKLVPSVDAARERIYQHSLVLEDARAQAAYGQHSAVGKILEIHQELPGRGHLGAPAHVPVLRAHRLLRQLAEPACQRPRPPRGASHCAFRRARRRLELVLPGQRRVRAGGPMTLPELHLADWRATKDTLHLYTQILGKIRLATTPPRNHWWNVPLYVDVRGLTTRRLHRAGTTFDITLDFIDHAVAVRGRPWPLAPLTADSARHLRRLLQRHQGAA